jgi:hypothetical protein
LNAKNYIFAVLKITNATPNESTGIHFCRFIDRHLPIPAILHLVREQA